MADENYDVRFEEDLRVHIVEAKDLPVGSNNNPRDTFCKVAFDQETVFQTETVDKSCNLIYDAEFNCEIPREFHSLKFSVCEKNKLDKVCHLLSSLNCDGCYRSCLREITRHQNTNQLGFNELKR